MTLSELTRDLALESGSDASHSTFGLYGWRDCDWRRRVR